VRARRSAIESGTVTIPSRASRVALAALLPVVLRLVLLPVLPAPRAGIHDEFSNLLAADTFLHGRLANPAPPFPEFFQTFHVLVEPVYASVYFPGTAAFLAAGRALFGCPWAGVVVSVALMCAAVALAFESLLPPRWALAGGLSFALLYGVESYWMNSFWGGAVPALGGALVLGGAARLAVPRTRAATFALAGIACGVGAGILLLSRPFEGFWMVVGAGVAVVWATERSARRAVRDAPLRSLVAAAIAFLPFAGFLLLYDLRVTGNAFVPPQLLNFRTGYVAPIFAWQDPRPAPEYPDPVLARFYLDWRTSEASVRLSGDARDPVRILWAWFRGFKVFGAAALAALLLAFRARSRRSRFLLVVLAIVAAGLSIERIQQLHYLAPAIALLFAVTLQGLRVAATHPALPRRFARALPALVLIAASVGLVRNVVVAARRTRLESGRTLGDRRAAVLAQLSAEPGRQLVFVRYGPDHVVHDEWVANGADLASEPVLFVRDRGGDDARLLAAFPGRRAWLLFADERDRLEPLRP
jgi:hypothetical protein